MKKNNKDYTDSDAIKKKMGDRLIEVMKMRDIGSSEMERTLIGYKKQTIYKYEKAKVWMPSDFINKCADLLEIHAGYLSGDDDFICGSYAEYESMRDLFSLDNSDDYFNMFKKSGLLLSADNGDVFVDGVRIELSSPSYTVSRFTENENVSKTFSEKEMNSYYKAVLEYINKYFDDFQSKEGDADD